MPSLELFSTYTVVVVEPVLARGSVEAWTRGTLVDLLTHLITCFVEAWNTLAVKMTYLCSSVAFLHTGLLRNASIQSYQTWGEEEESRRRRRRRRRRKRRRRRRRRRRGGGKKPFNQKVVNK